MVKNILTLSTITYQIDNSIENLEKEIFGINLDSYNLLKDTRENDLILDKINKEKQAKHCDKIKALIVKEVIFMTMLRMLNIYIKNIVDMAKQEL